MKTVTLPIYSRRSIKLVAFCFVLSGATGLIYEVLWARMLGLVFGASTPAVSTVLAAFMGGLALGSALAGRFAARIARPLRAYGLIEMALAVYAILVPLLFRLVDHVYALIWQQLHPGFFVFSLWRFVLSGATLLAPATLMGATLPLLAAVVLRAPACKSTAVTRLYTYNLAGAIIGTVAAGFLLLPALGLRKTIYVAAAINLMIGIIAVAIDRRLMAPIENVLLEDSNKKPTDTSAAKTVTGSAQLGELPKKEGEQGAAFWLFCAFVSGFVTISTQVAWTRLLTMIIGSSTYAFSIVLTLFLVGLSAGAFLVGRKDRRGSLRPVVFVIELFIALSLLLSVAVTSFAPRLLVYGGLRFQVDTWTGLLFLQIVCAAILILIPSLLMGIVMPLILLWVGRARPEISVGLVGRGYAFNTIGAIAGAFCAGFILIPGTGTRFTIMFAAALCILVAAIAFPRLSVVKDRDVGRALAVGGAVALILGALVFTPAMDLDQLSIGAYDSLARVLARARGGATETDSPKPAADGHELLFYEEGPTSTVSVRKDWGITSMAINGRTNASDYDMPTQVMLAQLPVLLAPSTNNGLIVGFASGVSAGAILQSPIKSVTCLELEQATIAGSRFFEHVNNRPLADARFHLLIDDARTFLRVNPTRFDIIMSEPSHPWVPGVANLFTEQFFELGRERLNDEGVFVQWLQTYQLSTNSLRSVLATFQKIFPHVMVFRVGGTAKGKDLILVGSRAQLGLDRIAERMRDSRVAAELARVDLKSESDVRAWYVCDETKLGPAVAGAIINTDDNMYVETRAPREAFLPLMQNNAEWIASLAKR